MSCFLSYTSSITGDCSNTNSGSFTIGILGDAPDYTIQWFSPITGTTFLGVGVTAYTQTNLSAGTYSFNIIDSCISGNTILPVNIYISTGTCVSITNIENTVCDANNGSLTVTTTNYYGQATFDLYDDITGLISNEILNQNSCVFTNLSYGTYYVIANDGGGCTGKSESVIIKQSSNLSFGLYKVDNAGCGVDSGKLFVTGLTGTPPYTYLWSNGETGDSITGLTSGTYTVTITDGSNCSTSNTQVINNISQVGLGAIYLTQPTCFTADGEVEIIITGGTAPFYYLGSNGVTNITFNRSVIFSGLGPGFFSIQVVDAGLCNFTTSTSLLTPKGMSIVNVDLTHSTCNNFSGVIGPIQVIGGTSPYTYSLTDSFGNTNSVTNYQSNWLFDGLPADTYTLSITDAGSCTYTDVYTINNQVLFGLTVSTTGTTCDSNDGSVYLEITSGGTPPYIFQINGSRITTTLTSYTFNNLFSGNYTASVTDKSFCQQSTLFTIDNSNTIDFHLLGVDSTNNDGSLTAFITNGTPPFTLYFDGDTVGTTVMTIPDLPPGNYSVRIVDSDGCSQRKSLPIFGTERYSSIGVYTICEANVLDQPITIQTGPKQLLNEGYNQLISENPIYTNCVLSSATFQVLVDVGGFTDSSVFYTSYSLLDYPSDEELYGEIQSLLEASPQIGDVDINLITNTIVVTTNCESESLFNTNLDVVMRIDYDIRCVCPPCDIKYDFDTPSQTPTNTMTPTPTMTKTPTPTPTPTMTKTPTQTPTNTMTPTNTPTNTMTPTPSSLTCSGSVLPPTTINGVTITDSSTGSVGTSPTSVTSCGSVTVPVNSKRLGLFGAFTYTMNFSVPINNLIVFIVGTGQSGFPNQENFVFTTNTGSGIPSITTTDSCYTTIVGNEILSGGAPIGGGGGKFLITNNVNFTSITISGDGGFLGSELAVCTNSIQPAPTNTPTQTPTNTLTPTKTATNTPTQTPTNTLTPTKTQTPTPTNTPTQTPTPTNIPITQTVTACDIYTWSVDGVTYNSSGTYTSGIYTLILTINNSTSSVQTVTASGSYTWSVNGVTYTTSGTYTFVGTNAAGCDDTYTLVLTIT